MQSDQHELPYTPYFCEENVYRLMESIGSGWTHSFAVFITNDARQVAMIRQRSDPQRIVVWDYHVVCLEFRSEWRVWDAESLLGAPVRLSTYLLESFPDEVPDRFAPIFRLVPARRFLNGFASDRRHMVDRNGAPIRAFPRWPAIHADRGSNLFEILDLKNQEWGRCRTLGELSAAPPLPEIGD